LKIVIFGLTISSSWGNGHATPYRALLRALHRRGHQVTFYEKDAPYYARRRDFARCDYCDLVLYASWDEIAGAALRDAASADVVITASYLPEGARINDAMLELARPLRVFYDLDAPITVHNLERGGAAYLRRDQMPEFDLYLSFTGGGILDELERKFGVRMARPLFGCVDPEAHARVPASADFECLLSYMGTYAADRQRQVEELFLRPARQRPEERFVLAGSLYPRDHGWPANVRVFEHVAPAEHPALYSSSRLALNVTRDGMTRYGYCPSGRFFEAAACGTPVVTDYWEGLETFFTPGEELFVASTSADVLRALDSSDGELRAMSRRARERTLAEHTGDRRAEELLAYLDEARTCAQREKAIA
jgi:spore maturation protein CgeB